ncbi:MAG: SurA N-terminal domain-containing protein [Clostridia bacterium]|nr:SurA N-terminal domain-containing protein [Clostridia bacterium]
MTKSKKFAVKLAAAVIAALMTVAAFAGCSLKVENPVVAKIGNLTIYASEYTQLFSSYYYYASSLGYDLSVAEDLQAFQDWILDLLIRDKVVVYMAQQNGIELTDEELAEVEAGVQSTYDSQVESYKSQVDSSITDEAEIAAAAEALFIAYMQDSGMTKDEYLETVRNGMIEEALYEKYGEIIRAEATIEDDAAQNYYDENLAEQQESYGEAPGDYYSDYVSYVNSTNSVAPFFIPEGYIRVKHILVQFDEDTAEGEEEKDYEQICSEIETHLENGAYTFDELIEMYNDDPGMESEPYMTEGYLVSEAITDSYLEGFAEAALALEEIGDVSPRVETTSGYHYIQLIERVESKVIPFEDVAEDIENMLLTQAQNTLFSTRVTEWVAEAPITKYSSRIRYYGVG